MAFWNMLFKAGPPNIDQLVAKKKVRSLVRALSHQEDVVIRKETSMKLGLMSSPRAVHYLLKLMGKGKIPLDAITAQALFSAFEGWIESRQELFEVLDFRKYWTFSDRGFQQISDILDEAKRNAAISRIGGEEGLKLLTEELNKLYSDIPNALESIGVDALPVICSYLRKTRRLQEMAVKALIAIGQSVAKDIQINEIFDDAAHNAIVEQRRVSR